MQNEKLLLAQKRAEMAAEKYKELYDYAPVGYLTISNDGAIIELNFCTAGMLGKEPSELITENFESFISEESINTYKDFLHNTFQNKEKSFCELLIINADNSKHYINVQGALTNNGSNCSLTLTNISESKQLQKELTVADRKLSVIIKGTNVGTWEWDINTDEIVLNERWARIVGYTLVELLPTRINLWNDLSHPDDIDESRFILKKHFVGELEYYERESRMRHKNGDWIWVLTTGRVLNWDVNGKPLMMSGILQEITGRKLIEIQLREKEVEYYNLANAGFVLIWRAGTDKLCNYFNDTWLNFTGRELKHELGTGWMEGIHPDDLENRIEIYNSAFEKREVFDMEYRLKNASGEYRWIRDLGTPNYNSKGEFTGYLGNCFDICQRKQAEHALKESEERYKKIINCLTDYLYTVKVKDGKVLETIHNEASFKVTGYTSEEFNSDPYLWINMVVPEDRDWVAAKFLKMIKGEDFSTIEHRIVSKNGKIRWVSDTAIPKYDLDGNLISYDGIITDITERKETEQALKESEEKFRMMVMNNPDLTMFQNEIGEATFINKQAYRVLGHDSEKFIGTAFPVFIHPGDASNTFNVMQEVMNGKSIENYEYKFISETGEIRYLSHNAKPVIVNNKFIGIVSSVRNITEQKLFEKALLESESKYKILSETKDIFLSIIAHDLIGPYRNNIDLLYLLQKNIYTYPLPKIEQFVHHVFQSTKDAFSLLESLLLWAKSQRGLLPFNPTQISLKELFSEKLDKFQEPAQQKNLKMVCVLEQNVIVTADESLLRIILRNLMMNAVKFTPEGGKITLTAFDRTDFIEINVIDTGIGIDADTLNKLFRLDANLKTEGTEKEQGSGLGLILCKEFVDKHNGNIWAESEVGKGSTFKFTIPKT